MYEIAPYLNRLERINFNQATLKAFPGERIHKKFPKDYTIKHHILALSRHYNSIVETLNYYTDSVEGYFGFDSNLTQSELERQLQMGIKNFAKLFNFLTDPMNTYIHKYHGIARKKNIELLEELINYDIDADDNRDFYILLSSIDLNYLIVKARHVLDFINKIPFEREISIKGITTTVL